MPLFHEEPRSGPAARYSACTLRTGAKNELHRVRAMPAEPVAAMRIRRPPPDPRDPIWPDRRPAHAHDLTPHSDRVLGEKRPYVRLTVAGFTKVNPFPSVLAMQIMGSIITFVEPAFHRLLMQASDFNQAWTARVPFPMKTQPARSPTASQTIRNATTLCHTYVAIQPESGRFIADARDCPLTRGALAGGWRGGGGGPPRCYGGAGAGGSQGPSVNSRVRASRASMPHLPAVDR